jgi:predicted phosphodiesterase
VGIPTNIEVLVQRSSLRVLVAGDTHGNTRWVTNLCALASERSCDLVLQLGDFGFDPASPSGARFLDSVDSACAEEDLQLLWIDGNHEHHRDLRRLAIDAEAPVAVRDHVWYVPRGVRLALAGVRFGFLGGAFSVDWRLRVPGTSWFEEETPTDSDLACLGDEPLDVLVCHDAPAGVPLQSGIWLNDADQLRADKVQNLLRRAVELTAPRLVLHGHWHHRHTFELAWVDARASERQAEVVWRSSRVEGFDCDLTGERAWGILELPSLSLDGGVAGPR